MKYIAASTLFLANNEILSLAALSIIAVLFCIDILKERYGV